MGSNRRTYMSARKTVVETYFDGFRRSDHDQILGCLVDDVIWDLPGYAHRVESYLVPLT
jgi:ketosteroid isomerase-like protein